MNKRCYNNVTGTQLRILELYKAMRTFSINWHVFLKGQIHIEWCHTNKLDWTLLNVNDKKGKTDKWTKKIKTRHNNQVLCTLLYWILDDLIYTTTKHFLTQGEKLKHGLYNTCIILYYVNINDLECEHGIMVLKGNILVTRKIWRSS